MEPIDGSRHSSVQRFSMSSLEPGSEGGSLLDHHAGSADGPAPVPRQSSRTLVYTVAFVGALGGFLFGFDTGVISGALPYIRDDLLSHIKDPERLSWVQGLIVSSAIAAAAVGAALGGRLSDSLGRKTALVAADVLFAGGAVAMGLAPNAAVLVLGRVLVGLGVGLASCAAPVFISECAPSDVRAALVIGNVFMITFGQFSAYLSDYILAGVPGTWRWMLGMCGVPAVIQILGLLCLPESPRWLAAQGRMDQARKVATQLHGREGAALVGPVRSSTDDESADAPTDSKRGWAELSSPPLRKQLVLGVGLQVLQQAAGINTIMYFTPSILQLAGVGSKRTALLVALLPAGVNAAGTLVGLVTVERFGRRRLLLSSTAGVFGALLLLASIFWFSEVASPAVIPQANASGMCGAVPVNTCFACLQKGCIFCGPRQDHQAAGFCVPADTAQCPATKPELQSYQEGCPSPYTIGILLALLVYLAVFAPGLGCVPWAVNSELFTPRVRGLGNGLAATANWVTNAVVSYTFLSSTKQLGASGTFCIYAALCGGGFIWLLRALPETRGLSLEQMQRLFAQSGS